MKGFEFLAKFMHDKYEEAAKRIGWNTQNYCKVQYKNLPKENKQVMDFIAKKVIELFAINKTTTSDKIILNCIREEMDNFKGSTPYTEKQYREAIQRIKSLLEEN